MKIDYYLSARHRMVRDRGRGRCSVPNFWSRDNTEHNDSDWEPYSDHLDFNAIIFHFHGRHDDHQCDIHQPHRGACASLSYTGWSWFAYSEYRACSRQIWYDSQCRFRTSRCLQVLSISIITLCECTLISPEVCCFQRYKMFFLTRFCRVYSWRHQRYRTMELFRRRTTHRFEYGSAVANCLF